MNDEFSGPFPPHTRSAIYARASRIRINMTVAKAIERVADHATNIAEEAFYLYRGEDIRHDHSLKGKG